VKRDLAEGAPVTCAPATTGRKVPLAGAALTATGASILGQAPGFLIPVVIAARLGASGTTDGLFVALAVSTFVAGSLAAAAPYALIPFIVGLRGGPEQRHRYLREVAGVMLVLATGAVVVVFGASHVVATGVSALGPDESRGAAMLLWALAPFVLVSGVTGVWAAALQAERAYVVPAVSPAVRAAAVLALLLWLPGESGAFMVVTGYVLGEIGRAAWLAAALARSQSSVPTPRLGWPSAEARSFARSAIAQVAGSTILGVTPVVDRLMAAGLGPGSVSVLDYAERLAQVPVGLAMSGFLVVSVSEWSRTVHGAQAARGLARETRRLAVAFFVASLPVCLGLVLARHWLTDLVFAHGRFPVDELGRLADTFGAYAIGLPIFMAGLVYTRAFLVQKRSGFLLRINVVQLVVKVGLNLWLLRYWGLPGIALATAAMYLVSMAILVRCFDGPARFEGER
jgi:putative peptidoglycan lipid II flippase